MNPKYVVSLELSKELKNAGWKKETNFWWVSRYEGTDNEIDKYGDWHITTIKPSNLDRFYLAPLSDEILEELPIEIDSAPLTIQFYKVWIVFYALSESIKRIESWQLDKSFSNALARCWLFLKKEGLIK